MPQARTAIVEAVLPEDPDNGTIFTVPEGQSVGASTIIYLLSGERVLGTANQLSPVVNVSKRYSLVRITSKKAIKKNDVVRVVAKQYSYTQMTFLDGYGWLGHRAGSDAYVIEDKTYRVTHVVPIGELTDGYCVYEQLCLERIKE